MNTKEIVVNNILSQLEKGSVPWEMPWFPIPKQNLVNKHQYRGINRMLLATDHNTFYMTYKQANSLGYSITKGAKGQMLVFWKITTYNNENEDEEFIIPIIKHYYVYGVNQINGIDDKLIEKRIGGQENKKNISIEDFLKITKAKINNINLSRAYYSPSEDIINVPNVKQFKSSDHYYSTTFHELIHWTGHEIRCKRFKSKGYSHEEYGKEELIAEIGSSLLAYEFGINLIKHNSSYIEGWIKKIHETPNIIFSAATKAEEAVNYLKTLIGE